MTSFTKFLTATSISSYAKGIGIVAGWRDWSNFSRHEWVNDWDDHLNNWSDITDDWNFNDHADNWRDITDAWTDVTNDW